MSKSIERIWKEGFTNNNLLLAPKIDNLDSLKSIYFVDKFKKMYQTNIIVLALTAIIALLSFILGGVPFIGMFMFFLFSSLAIGGQMALNKLNKIDIATSNYEFLKTFDDWLKNLLTRFSLVYRIWMPLFFIAFAWGVLQTTFFVPFLGETLMNKLVNHPNTYLLNGLPIFWIVSILLVALVLSYFSDYLFKEEVRAIYGGVIGRLEQLLSEIEELRGN